MHKRVGGKDAGKTKKTGGGKISEENVLKVKEKRPGKSGGEETDVEEKKVGQD